MNSFVISLSILALVISTATAVHYFMYWQKFSSLIKNTKGEGLQKDLSELLAKLDDSENEILKLKDINFDHETRLKNGISKVGVVRYNPFGDTGGDLSYSIALVNETNDGVVISSIHGREGTRTYAKPLENGKSKYNLSTEETTAISEAKGF